MKTIITLILAMSTVISFAQNTTSDVSDMKKLEVQDKEPIEEVAGGHKIEIKTSAICDMCKETLEYDLAFEKGVKEATLNLEDKVLTVVYNPKRTNPKKLRERITKVGYHADWMARDNDSYEGLPLCCKDGSHGTPVPQVPTKRKGNN